MKQLSFIFLSILLLSCQNNASSEAGNKQPAVDPFLHEVKTAIQSYIQDDWIKDPPAYKAGKWGKLDTVDAVDFTYKISHQFFARKNNLRSTDDADSLLALNKVFLLDKNLSIVNHVDTKDYGDYYDEEGLPYRLFGDKTLQRIGRKNGFDRVQFKNGKSILTIVGGIRQLSQETGTSKDAWIEANLAGTPAGLLADTDTVEHCDDLSGQVCHLYIFEKGKLKKVE